jgi:hypothetical protein
VRRLYASSVAAFAAIAFVVCSPSPGRACSICQAGDPLFSAGGATAQETGTFSAYLEFQAWSKKSGLLAEGPGEEPEPGQEVNDGRQLSLYLGWTPLDRFTLTLLLPWRWNEISEQPDEEEHTTSRLDGFGDLALNVGYVLWRDRGVLPAIWIEARSFVEAPTGASEQREDGRQDPHLQVGTGSWDYGFGLAGARRMEWASLYASAQYRINTEGTLDYRYGDVVLANLALDVSPSHFLDAPLFQLLTPGVELNFRYAEKDRSQGAGYADSGGSILFLTPSLRIRLPWWAGQRAPFLRLAVQVPLTNAWLNGFQDEEEVWSAGLGIAF